MSGLCRKCRSNETGKAGTAKKAGAAMVRPVAALAARKSVPNWLMKGALAGLIGFNLLFVLVLAPAPFLTIAPSGQEQLSQLRPFHRSGRDCPPFPSPAGNKEFIFNGKCLACQESARHPGQFSKTG